MWWRFCAILVLLLVVQQLHARQGVYDGPVVCTGTKPLIIHENYSNILATDADKKEYYEQYWYQIYNHLHGCEIIAGNLIIPHQHDVPFETKRLNEAIEKIEIVTGFIYIYDVGLDLDFRNLKMVYGNELFKYPSTWERDANSGEDYNVAFNKEYAIFVERFTADHLLMPQLRYIKRGNIGFKNVDKLCVWHPELQLLDFDEMFDDSFKQRVIKLDDKSFTNCDGISRDCVAAGRPKIGNIPAQICTKCFKNEEGYCQPSTKQFCPNDCLKKPNLSPTFCEVITPINLFCCPQHSHGGCSLVGEESSAFHCEKGYYLQIDTANLAAPRKCLDFCNGKVINGTDICLTRDGVSNADEEIECPDYMFTFDGGRKCSHHCPYGSEMDPIGNVVGDIDGIKDQARRDDLYKKYWPYHRKCKPCRMIYKTEDKDFVDDCGVHCVIQSNSLSFVTILNVYPAATDMKYYDLQTFTAIFTTGDHKNITDASSEIFKKQCRHIFGSLHIDQYSVGYPSNAKRLIAEHFRILTYATGLYGTIRIENTEGYWFAEPFRNLLAIDKPIPGKIALDQYIDNSVTVRYNSDLRTVDLQLLHYVQGEILVQYNPLYIPPRKLNAEKVFDHVKTIRNSPVVETVSENGLATTRTGKKITYDPGCKDNEVSFYYKRCVRCGAQEYRTFETKLPKPGDVEELFAECMAKSECNTEDGFYVLQRNGEDQCLKCDQECKKCTDQTSFSCYEGTDKNTLVCKHKKLVARNIQLCIGDGPCQAGFLTDGTNCVRCDKACVTCNDGKKDDNGLMFYSIPKPSAPKQGCRGCGFVFLAKQKNGNYVAVCGFSVGTHPRCASGETCHYFTNNILRDLWRKMKPKGVTTTKKDSFADYGES